MKYLGLIAAICAALALVACGDDASSDEAKGPEKLTKPKVDPPPGPPPTELVINDIVEGDGPEAEVGDEVTLLYVGVTKTDAELYNNWLTGGFGPLVFELGKSEYGQGFEEGVEGMKPGGRRELHVPANLAFKNGPIFYVVDLLKIK